MPKVEVILKGNSLLEWGWCGETDLEGKAIAGEETSQFLPRWKIWTGEETDHYTGPSLLM